MADCASLDPQFVILPTGLKVHAELSFLLGRATLWVLEQSEAVLGSFLQPQLPVLMGEGPAWRHGLFQRRRLPAILAGVQAGVGHLKSSRLLLLCGT